MAETHHYPLSLPWSVELDMKVPTRGAAWGRVQCWQRSELQSFRLQDCPAVLGTMFILAGFAEYISSEEACIACVHSVIIWTVSWMEMRDWIFYSFLDKFSLAVACWLVRIAHWEKCIGWEAKMCGKCKGATFKGLRVKKNGFVLHFSLYSLLTLRSR